MELKRGEFYSFDSYKRLLIVPYGIETILSIAMRVFVILLIVPYGIETEKIQPKQ